MSCGKENCGDENHKHSLSCRCITAFNKCKCSVAEWEKKQIKKVQDKFGLSDYQMLWLSFGKGFIIGAILL